MSDRPIKDKEIMNSVYGLVTSIKDKIMESVESYLDPNINYAVDLLINYELTQLCDPQY